MAKMYGNRGREKWDSPDNKTKNYFKGREERQWSEELYAELDNEYVFSRPMAGYSFDSTRVRSDDDG